MDPKVINANMRKVEDWSGVRGVLSNSGFTEESSIMALRNPKNYFEVSFQYKLDSACECELGYLLKDEHQKNYQLVVPEKHSTSDSLFRPGALQGKIAPKNLSWAGMGDRYLKSTGAWNTGRIIVDKEHAEHWMNGFKIVEYPIQPDTTSDFRRVTIDGMSGKAALRNLKIRSL